MEQTFSTSRTVNNGATGSAFVKRYEDLYRAATIMTGLGDTVKVVGIVLAPVIFMFWFIVAIAMSSSWLGPVAFFMCLVIGIALGALVGGLFFLLGVLISAQGQLLMSHADAAVHTSPFLSDQQRAAAMSLPFTAATATAAAG